MLQRFEHLDPDQIAQVERLMQAAGDTDGALPLSEHVVLHLRHGGEAPAIHLLAYEGDRVVGYAHIDTTDAVEGAAAELVVHPLHRRHGIGRALVTEAMRVADERNDGRLRLWAHGDHPSASALAIRLGFDRTRVLLQLRRSLFAPLDEVRMPEGVRLRAFRPGVDDEAWLALNAAAFADHPEQGKWTLEDLHVRLREPWFDAEGFLLAESERDGGLLGFHWTKVHGHEAHDPIGEVYVLGVSPDAHGGGLGKALTLAGLWYLRARGLTQVMLYVDESNTRAVALYQRLGFVRWSNDVSFQRTL
ncbi:mycothiol acetyltransferase [Dactylosporangium sucinum]|uniref:Mycothiol acetyltransferase n=1 Tax=Dactylosporangium sucinum TaxID=1424081 RepID=A0A917X5L7_9ACTN|nr:mycothiol synthase [Dactylosporangium sucinum]GGM70814.1 mycothiol acetyltransferase [Dactylosporangium sucinum]